MLTMKERVLIENVPSLIGKRVRICGWIHSVRNQGNLAFLLVRDRTGIAQAVTTGSVVTENDIRNETVVSLAGTVIEDKRAKSGVEIKLEEITVISKPVRTLPIMVNEKAIHQRLELETILNNRVLALRNPKRNLIFKLQAEVIDSFRTFFRDHGFTEITTPKIIVSGTEGGTQLFSVDYFDKLTYLAQSPQFYKQMLVGAGYERVFEIGHVYRAEIHNTSRHLNEYVSLDYEMGFIQNEHDVMDIEEEFILTLIERINRSSAHILKEYKRPLKSPKKIPRIPIKEACAVLKDEYGKRSGTLDLDPNGEKLICDWAKSKFSSEFDLLFRGLEITTGGQRIHDHDMLVKAFEERNLNPADFDYYLDTFAYGMPPHGGLAIGLERITCQILGLTNVREASIFPRDRNRVVP
jgi:nondiscriminating aspartyl-tRNA synthetase